MPSNIDAFLAGSPHAVAGASRDRSKFGNKVLRNYLQRGMPVYAVNPSCAGPDGIEGVTTVATLADLPEPVHGLSIITPPTVTARIVEDAIAAGIGHLWMQPGAEDARAMSAKARRADLRTYASPCNPTTRLFSNRAARCLNCQPHWLVS